MAARWHNQILGKATGARIIFLEPGKPPFLALYLLHGLSDDSSMRMRRSRVEMYAEPLPLLNLSSNR